MAFKLADLLFRISADTKKFDRGMAKSKKGVSRMTSTLNKFKGVLIAAFAGVGLMAIKRFIGASIELYDIQAKAEASLLTALKGREDIQQRLMKQASELQKITLFGDEATIQAMALLGTFGLTEEQIRNLIPLIQDMATGLGMDLKGAASLVGKTVATTTDALARYFDTGLKGVIDKSERSILLTNALSKAFEGQSKAAALAGTGGLKQISMAFDDLKEDIGEAIIEAGILEKGLKKLKEIAESLMNLWGRAEGKEEAVKYLEELGDIPNKTDVIKDKIFGLKIELSKLERSFGNITGLKIFGQTITWNKKKAKELQTQINNLTAQIQIFQAALRTPLVPKVTPKAKAPRAKAPAGITRREPSEITKKPKPVDPEIISAMFYGEEFVVPGLAGIAETLERGNEKIREAAEAYRLAMEPIIQMNDVISQSFVDLGVSIGEGIGDMLTGITKAEDVFGTILKSVAKFAGQFGRLLLAIGIAEKAFLESFNFQQKIAAGIALIVLSKVAMNLLSKQKDVGGGGGATGMFNPSYATVGQTVQFDAVIKGEDIYLSNQRTAARYGRIGIGSE